MPWPKQDSKPSPCFPLLLAAALALGGCRSSLEWVGMKILFDPAPWPEEQVVAVTYGDDDPERQRFDLYLPDDTHGKGWATLVFVHGGGWTEGSIDLEAGGYPIYGNIGGFYARQGLAVAVVEYRLQTPTDTGPGTDGAEAPRGQRATSPVSDPRTPTPISWHHQVRDIARAIARVRREVAERGGDPEKIVLSGHSAGAQLAAFTAVTDWPRQEVPGLGRPCGVVAISGAGYDLADEETYRLGASPAYYEARFHDTESGETWRQAASLTDDLDPTDPPFLVFYAGREHAGIRRQARLVDEKLRAHGVPSRLSVVEGQGHRRIVVTFSQGGHSMTQQTLDFVREVVASCQDRGTSSPG